MSREITLTVLLKNDFTLYIFGHAFATLIWEQRFGYFDPLNKKKKVSDKKMWEKDLLQNPIKISGLKNSSPKTFYKDTLYVCLFVPVNCVYLVQFNYLLNTAETFN